MWAKFFVKLFSPLGSSLQVNWGKGSRTIAPEENDPQP